jgi:uncharacterized membrane protein
MPTPLISPNLHVVLIHYPMAMLIAGVFIELFSFLWPRSSFRVAGRWMILLGALSAVVAAYSGIYALRDVSRVAEGMPWLRFKIDSPVFSDPKIWAMMWKHTLYQSIAAGVSALVVTTWLGCSDKTREALRLPFLVILLGTVSVIVFGAWLGGESIYRHGVAVCSTAKGADAATQPASWRMDAGDSWATSPTKYEKMFPPVELHVIFAGMATAIALASIGLSFRKLTTLYEAPTHRPITARDETMAPRQPASPNSMARTLNPDLEIDLHFSAPAGRFWMLTFLIALMTAVGGLFVLARSASIPLDEVKQPKQFISDFRKQIQPEDFHKPTRVFVHFVTGSAIVVLPLFLAFLARFAPRKRILLSVCAGLLIIAVAAQVWFGVLLLYDTEQGPLKGFNTALE